MPLLELELLEEDELELLDDETPPEDEELLDVLVLLDELEALELFEELELLEVLLLVLEPAPLVLSAPQAVKPRTQAKSMACR